MSATSLLECLDREDKYTVISDMADLICQELGTKERSSYKTRTFDIHKDPVEIRYRGLLVFREGIDVRQYGVSQEDRLTFIESLDEKERRKTYYRSGSWEKQFERLYLSIEQKRDKQI